MDWLRVPFWESVFSLSNGVLGSRGSFDEPMHDWPTRPMTFMAGLYDTLPEGLPEWPLLPDWLTTKISLGGSRFDLRLGHTMHFRRWLDLRRGVLHREIVWRDLQGRTTRLKFVRFLSLADRRVGASRVRITPLDWSGAVDVEAGITAPPAPKGGPAESHWSTPHVRASTHAPCSVEMTTRQTRRALGVAAALQAHAIRAHSESAQPQRPAAAEAIADAEVVPATDAVAADRFAGRRWSIDAVTGATYAFDRCVSFVAAAPDEPSPVDDARRVAAAMIERGFDAERESHVTACAALWDAMDVEIDGPDDDQRAIRFNLFQLATLGPPPELIASIGPKGLSGTHYLGHIFWDTEIYMVPFFALTNPPVARTLLEYRFATLDGARRKARANHYRGAQYAWESADTGDEACPRSFDTPDGERIRIWCGDIQDHISADVPYAIDRYVHATGDVEFLRQRGAEIIFETARFWVSRVTTRDDGRAAIRDVMGPDEFHIHVDNDAYTNYLAHWNLLAAADLWDDPRLSRDRRDALAARLDLDADEVRGWRDVADALVLPYDAASGFIEQSDGFTARPDVGLDALRVPRRGSITELIGPGLCIEGQVLKQAEVVVMQCLLPDRFDRRSREVNFDYYEPRTSHDSSLSVSAHAWAAAALGRAEQAYAYFRRAAFLDLDDLAGNTDAGLHTANMGGVWLAVAFGFAGIAADGDNLVSQPCLPPAWKGLRIRCMHRGRRRVVVCDRTGARIEPA